MYIDAKIGELWLTPAAAAARTSAVSGCTCGRVSPWLGSLYTLTAQFRGEGRVIVLQTIDCMLGDLRTT